MEGGNKWESMDDMIFLVFLANADACFSVKKDLKNSCRDPYENTKSTSPKSKALEMLKSVTEKLMK